MRQMIGKAVRSGLRVNARWLLRDLDIATLQKVRPNNAIDPNWTKMAFLYRLVRRHRPNVVVELGSGWSTTAIALALSRNGDGRFYAYDVDPHWLDITRKMIQSDPARSKFCTLALSPIAVVSHEGQRVFQHVDLTDAPIDFLYLDSPPLTSEIQVAIDPLVLEPQFAPKALVAVDGRRQNVEYLKRHLKGRYKISVDRVTWTTVFEKL